MVDEDNPISSGVRIFYKPEWFRISLNFKPLRAIQNKLMICRFEGLQNNSIAFNLAAVHFHSKVGNSERQQMYKSREIVNLIEEFELKSETNDTIIVGDLNHNPYDENMNDCYFLQVVDSRDQLTNYMDVELNGQKLEKGYWYNPMWNLLGDYDYNNKAKIRPTGTYYRNRTDELRIWNLLDGFIVRPSMMWLIDFSKTNIITTFNLDAGNKICLVNEFVSSLSESRINETISDHLPVQITLNFQ